MNCRNKHIIGLLLFAALTKGCDPYERITEVQTNLVDEITFNSCVAKGTMLDFGDGDLERYGFCYDTIPRPTILKMIELIEYSDRNTFEAEITGLKPDTEYYLRAFAQTSKGVFYGLDIPFKTRFEMGTFTDVRDSKSYPVTVMVALVDPPGMVTVPDRAV